jgi:hypothetical protein
MFFHPDGVRRKSVLLPLLISIPICIRSVFDRMAFVHHLVFSFRGIYFSRQLWSEARIRWSSLAKKSILLLPKRTRQTSYLRRFTILKTRFR